MDDPATWLAAADVLVMPSRRGARPLSPIEAALVGTPTAAFAVGGLSDLADQGAVLAAPYPDAGGLAQRVRELLDNSSLAGDAVDNSMRLWRAELSPEVVGPAFVQLVHKLLTTETRSR